MIRPIFTPRRTQPMRTDSYLRIARLLREAADKIEAAAPSSDPQQKRALTVALHTLSERARDWWMRHRATIYHEPMPPKDL